MATPVIRMMNPRDLIPYENNPRVNQSAVDSVAESISQLGFRSPIMVDNDLVIVAGHTRRLAALKLGLRSVPVVVCEDMTPDQARAYRLADNKTGELAGWDFDSLGIELDALGDIFDMTDFGFADRDGEEEMTDYVEMPDVADRTPQEPRMRRVVCPCCGRTFEMDSLGNSRPLDE